MEIFYYGRLNIKAFLEKTQIMTYRHYFSAIANRLFGDDPLPPTRFTDVTTIWMQYDCYNPDSQMYNEVMVMAARHKNEDGEHTWSMQLHLAACRSESFACMMRPTRDNLHAILDNFGDKAFFLQHIKMQKTDDDRAIFFKSDSNMTTGMMLSHMKALDMLILSDARSADRNTASSQGIAYEPRKTGCSLDTAVKLYQQDKKANEPLLYFPPGILDP